uniref:B30.2/SPRY domain-containing protein n=1 Tax=Neolamprologus brichardi TaxID=32507 RepID=A0A3Q4N5H0_NEOBR
MVLNAIPPKDLKVTHIQQWFPCLTFMHSDFSLNLFTMLCTIDDERNNVFILKDGVQQYAVDVTLDPDTAHPFLILSDDGKQVHCDQEENDLPDNPERFSKFGIVLGKQSFSSGRFYFEVQVKAKTLWMLGVARESVNRKEEFTFDWTPKKGYWCVFKGDENLCVALKDPPVRVSFQSYPEKVGVFVDYEEGLVSFHDVEHATLIYSFTGRSFTEKLYPLFCPGFNDDGKISPPLIICPVMGDELTKPHLLIKTT